MTEASLPPTPVLPKAVVAPPRRWSFAWLITIAAALFALWLGWRSWSERGEMIEIRFDQGHGIRAGDALRHRGVEIGRIETVRLSAALDTVVIEARLTPDARRFARRGSQFWIVRPEFDLSGVRGVDTLVGPRYIGALPGRDKRARSRFVGLEQAPLLPENAGGLEVILEAGARGSLRAGAAVRYREMQIGTVLSVHLASDGASVEARVHIEPPYVELVRADTRFWDAGGVRTGLGWTGLYFETGALSDVLVGGVALATPPNGGPVARTGRRYRLAETPREEWLAWEPRVSIGTTMLPPGSSVPQLRRAALRWTQGRVFKSDETRSGWVMHLPDGVIGPGDLFRTPASAREGTTVLECDGEAYRPSDLQITELGGGLVQSPSVRVSSPPWPPDRLRRPETPEDCVVVGDAGRGPSPLAAARFEVSDHGDWLVNNGVTFSREWHGAAVVARSDGAIVGWLLVDEPEDEDESPTARVVLTPESLLP